MASTNVDGTAVEAGHNPKSYFRTVTENSTEKGDLAAEMRQSSRKQRSSKKVKENPLNALTVRQKIKIQELSQAINAKNEELMQAERLVLQTRQRPGSLLEAKKKKQSKNSRKFEGDDATQQIKNGAVQLMKDKEVALTQHDISVLHYQKEIMELLAKGKNSLMPWMKGVGCCLSVLQWWLIFFFVDLVAFIRLAVQDNETLLKQNKYMITTLKTEMKGLRLEVFHLMVTDPAVSRLHKELKVREDMLASREIYHTSIAGIIGDHHETIQMKRHLIAKHMVQSKLIRNSILMLKDLLTNHDQCKRHELIRKPNRKLVEMMTRGKITMEKLKREDVNAVLGHEGVVEYFGQRSAGYHAILKHSTDAMDHIMDTTKVLFEEEEDEDIKQISDTILMLLQRNADARKRRNLFIEGLIVQKSTEQYRVHEDMINEVLMKHLSDPRIQERRMKCSVDGM